LIPEFDLLTNGFNIMIMKTKKIKMIENGEKKTKDKC